MEYFNLEYWEDYKLEDRPVYGIPDYRLMRLLEEVALVVEENKKLKEKLALSEEVIGLVNSYARQGLQDFGGT